METPVRDRLKKKSKKKQGPVSENDDSGEPDIFAMMSQVTKMLKENPEIINKVNKMVSGVMNNKELIESLATQFQGQDQSVAQDQTLASKSATESRDAVSNESKQ
jgi:hypothetical protein